MLNNTELKIILKGLLEKRLYDDVIKIAKNHKERIQKWYWLTNVEPTHHMFPNEEHHAYITAIKLLLNLKVDIELHDRNLCTPLMNAINTNCVEMVKLLLKAGANIEAKDSNDWTPLIYATTMDIKT